MVLRLLSDRRDDVVAQRTRSMNRLHVLQRDLEPGGVPRHLSTITAAAFLAGVLPLTPADHQRSPLPGISSPTFGVPTQLRAMAKTITTEVAGSADAARDPWHPSTPGASAATPARWADSSRREPLSPATPARRRSKLSATTWSPSAQPDRQPPAEFYAPYGGHRPGPRRRTRAGALRPQECRAEDAEGSPAQPGGASSRTSSTATLSTIISAASNWPPLGTEAL